ncbi:retrovirus-related pol polyprotein from transposon TNT 1-94 [Tanacetum coccineum]
MTELEESNSPELDLFLSEEETTKIMMETMEQYMSKTHGNYGSGVVRPKINDKTHFELKGKYLKELRKNTFSGSEHEDANAHIKKFLKIVDLFHIPEVTPDQVMLRVFPMSLTGAATQLNNLGREIKKVNKRVYTAQVGCELCKGPHYTKDCPLKEERNNLEEAYYTQFGAPYQPAGQYRAAGPGFYQRNNENSSYPDRRQTLEESLTKFMAESAKRHEVNANIIKEIQASTDAAIRNQGASIKTLEIQIGQMSKVLQERGIGGLPDSTEPNPRDHVKSISTAKSDSSEIRQMGCSPYAVSGSQHRSIFSEKIPFPRRLQNYYYDD